MGRSSVMGRDGLGTSPGCVGDEASAAALAAPVWGPEAPAVPKVTAALLPASLRT